jgi:hypothetical protein
MVDGPFVGRAAVEGSLTGIAPRQLTAVLARRLTEEPALF